MPSTSHPPGESGLNPAEIAREAFRRLATRRIAPTPDAYRAFLAFFFESIVSSPYAVIAAGHGATYVLAHAAAHPASLQRLVLIAPTWRGPLPTMMNGHRPFFDRICRTVDQPVLGPLLWPLAAPYRGVRIRLPEELRRLVSGRRILCDRNAARNPRLRGSVLPRRASGHNRRR